MARTRRQFTITSQHMKLLDKMSIGWNDCEFGAPSVDCKRPFGSSGAIHDLGRILGVTPEGDGEFGEFGEFSTSQFSDLMQLYRETETVLQILVHNAASGVRPGETYELRDDHLWRRLG